MEETFEKRIPVALYGGSFDPPHEGHTALIKYLLRCGDFNEVLVMPCYKHMYNKRMASAKDRLEMCRLATEFNSRIKVLDYEIKNQLVNGGTYNMLERFLAEDFAKNYNLYFVIGGDNAASFDHWYRWQDLLKMVKFVVFPRTGINVELYSRFFGTPHIVIYPDVLAPGEIPAIASTSIRKGFSLRATALERSSLEFCRRYLNTNVYNYILQHNLYEGGNK